MPDPYIGEIIMFAGNFAPRGWALCDGQLLDIASHSALFSILGTTYGGDGRTTFALPDLRSRAPVHPGHGPGLPDRRLGEKFGGVSVTLTAQQMPAHSHVLHPKCSAHSGTAHTPVGNYPAITSADDAPMEYGSAHDASMGEQQTESSGGGAPVSVQGPSLGVNFIIALQGVFPSRS